MKVKTLLWVGIGLAGIATVYFLTRSEETKYSGPGSPSGGANTGGFWDVLPGSISALFGGKGVWGYQDDQKKDYYEGDYMGPRPE